MALHEAVPRNAIRSLYLPGVGDRRAGLASAVAHHWGTGDLGIPLRRVLAVRDG